MHKSLLTAALMLAAAASTARAQSAPHTFKDDYVTRAKKKHKKYSKRELAGVPRVNKSDRKRNKANRWG